MTLKKRGPLLASVLLCLIMSACGGGQSQQGGREYPTKYASSEPQTIESVKMPTHPGALILSDGALVNVDYSNTHQGYIQATLRQEASKKIKLKITKDDKKYFYDVVKQDYETYPLQMGDGVYTISILQNTEGDMYSLLASQQVDVKMETQESCYLYPNQTVSYTRESNVVSTSFELVVGDKDDLTRLYHLYDYVITTLKYDDAKAKASENEYMLPDLDVALSSKKGICYDYAALLAAMCRIQNIPAKVIVGDTDIEYHAWVEIYLEGEGWINPAVYFEGQDWSLVDPTFAATKAEYEGRYSEVYHY